MPSSNLSLAPEALLLIAQSGAKRILDIGPGNGKYGLICREYLGPQVERLDAVEAENSYIEKFPWLDAIYDKIMIADGSTLTEEELDDYDTVLMFDVIEHIEKDRALELLSRINGSVCVITPVEFFEQHVDGVPSEDHVSHWTAKDFKDTGRAVTLYHSLGGIICRLEPKLGLPQA